MSKISLAAAAGIVALALAGCQVQMREAAAPGTGPYRQPRATTRDDLIQRIHKASDPLDSFTMRANLAPSAGNADTGVITRYSAISAYIFYRHPDHLRVTGQDPLISSTLFDMVSMGEDFRLSLPRRNRFVMGNNDAPPNSGNPLENIRPASFLAALILNPPELEKEITVLEESVKEGKPAYALLILRAERGGYRLVRGIYFDAYNLQIVGQRTFDSSGRIASDATYSNWKDYAQEPFPSNIYIKGPQNTFQVGLTVLSLSVNPVLDAGKFVWNSRRGRNYRRWSEGVSELSSG
jgi:hypothetical protein